MIGGIRIVSYEFALGVFAGAVVASFLHTLF